MRQNYMEYFEQIVMQMYIEVDKTEDISESVKAIIEKQIEQSKKGEQ